MPISATAQSPTQSNPYSALAASAGNPATSLPGFNFPGMSMPSVDMAGQRGSPQGVFDLLSKQPQSLTNIMAPLYQQLFSQQGGALQSAFGQQAETGMAQAVSDASRRGLTGSSIEEGGIQSAFAGAGQGYQQALASLLGQVTGQYGQMAQFDIGQGNQYYQNLAQALGQDYAQQQQMSMFQQQLSAGMGEAGMSARAQERAGMYGAIGSLGGGALFAMSDVRLKRDERVIGSWRGLRLWRFRYRDDVPGFDLPRGEHVGLMAHDVPAVYRGATRLVKGYLAIDYPRLLKCMAVDLSLRHYLKQELSRA